jgi:hypothetical protein
MEITYQDYLTSIGEATMIGDSGKEREQFTSGNCEEIFYLNNENELWYDLDDGLVDFELYPSRVLEAIADSMMEADGHLPFFRDNADGESDGDGWYDFYLRVHRNRKVEVYFDVAYSRIENFNGSYDIDLTEEEQKTILEYILPIVESNKGYAFDNIDMNSFFTGGPLYGEESD